MTKLLPSSLLVFLLSALAIPASGCSEDLDAAGTTDATESPATGEGVQGSPGGLLSTHGMVLFGSEKLYISHVPLFQAPHNVQLVAEVKIRSGVPTDQQRFATQNFTIRPDPFSLVDLAQGRLTSITGTIFLGNFEAGGRPIFQNVIFDVSKVALQRMLSPATPASSTLDYLAIGTPTETFLVHVIDQAPSFDSIVHVELGDPAVGASSASLGTSIGGLPSPSGALDAQSLAAGILVRIADRTNSVTSRLGALGSGTLVTVTATPAPNGDPSSVSTPVRGLQENSCLTGPNFFGPCPAAL